VPDHGEKVTQGLCNPIPAQTGDLWMEFLSLSGLIMCLLLVKLLCQLLWLRYFTFFGPTSQDHIELGQNICIVSLHIVSAEG
jgi:hypothetical protein